MSGPSPAARASVHTAWIRFGFTGSIAMAGWDCEFAATMIGTSGEKLPPPSVDLEKNTSDWVTVPPQPANAMYATPSEPIAMDGFAAVYAGGRSTMKLGPKRSVAG